MRVFDCFTFYNEFELLELRLESLWDVVDRFVIVESNKTHANKPKPYNFLKRQADFKKYLHKIRYVMEHDEVPFKGLGDWSIENNQRNAIARGLEEENAQPDDLVFISDVDEIPAPDIIERLQPKMELLDVSPISMQQSLHYYYINMVSSMPWVGTVLSKYKNLVPIKPQGIRNGKDNFPLEPNGGWHFSYMGGFERVMEKLHSIVEGSVVMSMFEGMNMDWSLLKKRMMAGKDIFCRDDIPDFQLCKPEDIKLPALAKFVEKYPHFVKR